MLENESEKQLIIKAIKQLEQSEIKKMSTPINLNYLEKLNDSQKIAATCLDGNYLVIAGPGAGKTHTLIYRVVHLIKSGVSAKELCIVTFTRKAANQMKYRITTILPGIELGFVGTIHSLAYTLIRRGVGTKERIIDPEDDLMVLKLVISEGNFNIPSRTQLRTLHKIFDYMSLTMRSMEKTLVDLNREEMNQDDLMKIYNAYTDYKKKNGYINYSDCIALAKGADRGELKYLMVDEFQDTDPLQLSMFKSLKFPNVMAIGDDFQSIYSFRGADNTIILKFGQHFNNAKVIKLNVNYRSSKEIVDLENFVTNKSDYGYKKDLISYTGNSGYPIRYFDYNIERKNFIIDRIMNYNKKEVNDSIAVIYRYNRRKSEIESQLIQNKIDYVVYGGIRLLERKHIKDLFAILLANKNKNDFIPYMRALTLIDGIGEVTAKKLIENGMNSQKLDVQSLRIILFNEYTDINKVIIDAEQFYLSLDSVLRKSNYTLEEIKEDFNLIKGMAKNYKDISNFISDIIFDSSQDKWSNQEKRAKVVLTTIHSAKGLEFDEVHFIYDAEIQYTSLKQEENRRLFYTAISRAKNNLFIYDSWGRKSIEEIITDFQNDIPINNFIYNQDTDSDINKFVREEDIKSKKQKRSFFHNYKNVSTNYNAKKVNDNKLTIRTIIKKIISYFR